MKGMKSLVVVVIRIVILITALSPLLVYLCWKMWIIIQIQMIYHWDSVKETVITILTVKLGCIALIAMALIRSLVVAVVAVMFSTTALLVPTALNL